jgi:hypothetical protein
MNLADVMDEIGDKLDTITGLRIYRFPPDSVNPPAAIVTYPETYTYDETFGRGSDRMTLRVIVLVGRVSDRSSRNQLGDYVDGSGSESVKAVIESGTNTDFDTARVTSVEFDMIQVSGVDHVGATFMVDIFGEGA